MAKKKKPAHKRSKIFPYSTILTGFALCAVVLVGYCYFTADSDTIPLIKGPNYPKRTAGVASQKTTYAVYDRLAQSTEHTDKFAVSRLLPPDEVPQWTVANENDEPKQSLTSATYTSEGVTHSGRNDGVSDGTAFVSNSTSISSRTKQNSNQKFEKTVVYDPQSTKADNPYATKTLEIKKSEASDALKSIRFNLQNGKNDPKFMKKNTERNPDKTKLQNKSTEAVPDQKVVRMQIGGLHSSSDQPHQLIQRLMQKGGAPKGMHFLVQKAVVKGKLVYRVVLSGRCSSKTLNLYQNWLRKQRL